MKNETLLSKRYLYYLLGILSLFVAFRSFTLDGPRTTALVWYFFPDLDFETGLTYLSYVGVIAGLGSFISIYFQKLADRIGRKPLLIFVSVVLTIMPLIQILTDSIIIFTITMFFLSLAANVNVWMIYINEESPKGKNAIWSTIILIVGIIGPVIFYATRSFFITNDKTYTILHWKGILYPSVIAGSITTMIIFFTIKESSAYILRGKSGEMNKLIDNNIPLKKGIRIIFKDERKRSYIMLLVISVLFSIAIGSGNLLEPYMMNYSQMSAEEFSMISMVGLFGLIGFYFITGRLADRSGRRSLLIIYSFLYPISVILQFTWGAHIPVDQMRFIVNIILKILGMSTRAGLWTLLMVISIEVIPTEVRGVGNGLLVLLMNITGLMLGISTAPLFPIFGIQQIALVLTCFMFPIIPLVMFYIPESYGTDLKTVE
ncbi:MAG: MFS transporter [Promethearchaeota archaeon]|jgi:MFS family permease